MMSAFDTGLSKRGNISKYPFVESSSSNQQHSFFKVNVLRAGSIGAHGGRGMLKLA